MSAIHSAKRRALRNAIQSSPKIIVFVGSAFLSMLDHPEMFEPNCIIILIDVPEELGKLKFLHLANAQIIKWPLGKSKTIKKLVDDYGSEKQQKAFSNFSNISPRDGLGQARGLGRCAILDLLKQPEVNQRIAQLVPMLTEQSGGHLNLIELDIYSGTSGGVGSEGAVVMHDTLTAEIERRTTTPIHVNVHLLGAMTYQSAGFERTAKNAACAIVDWAVRANGSGQITVTVFAHEAAPVGDNRTQRDQLLLDQQAALMSDAVKQRIRQDRSNRTANGKLGNVFVPRTTFFGELDPQQIRSDVAFDYLPQFKALLDTKPTRGTIFDISFRSSDAPATDVDPGELLESLESAVDVGEISDTLMSLRSNGVFEAVLQLSDGTEMPFCNLTESYSGAISVPDQVRSRLGLLLELTERLDDEIAELEEEFEEFGEIEVEKRRAAVSSIRAIQRRSLINLRSPGRCDVAAIASISDYLTCAAALDDVEHELQALTTAREEAKALTESLQLRLLRLHDETARCLRFGDHVEEQHCVTARPLEQTFAILSQSIDNAANGGPCIGEILSRCSGEVTLFGLSKIVGAVDPSIDAIVTATVQTGVGTPSPHWGGDERNDGEAKYLVYPVLSERHQSLLSRHHKDRGGKLHVCFSRRDAPSRNAAIVEIRSCRDLKDFLTDFYRLALRDAIEDEVSPLYMDDFSLLSKLDIDVQIAASSPTNQGTVK